MENVAKGLVALAVLSFIGAVLAGLMGGALMGFPAESFSRACSNLALVAIANRTRSAFVRRATQPSPR